MAKAKVTLSTDKEMISQAYGHLTYYLSVFFIFILYSLHTVTLSAKLIFRGS